MSLVVICMALAIISMQGALPTGAILIFAVVVLIPALLVDALVFVGFSRAQYEREVVGRNKDVPDGCIERESDDDEST